MALFSRLFSRKNLPARSRDRMRLNGVEPVEPRYLLSADPIDLGIVYVEQDSGTDARGDQFELTWSGGAEGSQLTQLVIDGDQNIRGFGVGDVFFDTTDVGFGVDESSAFQLGTHGGIDGITATVEDGSSTLVLQFDGFEAGERLFFTIDVDEVEDFDPEIADTDLINEGFDPITSGVEFQGSLITADFVAPRYFDASGSAEFRNRYDDALIESGLDLPADNEGEQRDRTAAAFLLDLAQQPIPASISGHVFHDRDNDGSREVGEEGISEVLVTLVDENGTIVDAQFTDENGFYSFEGLAEGTYSVVESHPSNYTDGLDTPGTIGGTIVGAAENPGDTISQITLLPGDAAVDYDFGEYFGAEISGRVQQSTRDGDCFGDSEDHAPVVGAIVQLLDSDGNILEEVVTDANGEYAFTDLVPGEYALREITPDEFVDGGAQAGSIDGESEGLVDPAGTIRDISLLSGEVSSDNLFCDHKPAKIGGEVFHDRDGDGIRDPGEEGIPGVEIQLLDEDGNVVQTVITDENGNYEFTDVEPGTYMIMQLQPDGWLDGTDSVGEVDGEQNGSLAPGGDKINDVEVGWGDTGTEYNFGEQLPGTISGRVFGDHTLLDCEFDADAGDQALAGVVIELIDAEGEVVATTTTNEFGEYFFDEVPPASYSIRQIQPDAAFDNDATAGSAGGDTSVANLIREVTVGSGEDLTGYDYCEILPVMIAGFVFQDGGVVELEFDEELPERIRDVRSGERTDDDTFLSGVTLQLRDGLSGAPLNISDYVLPGSLDANADAITTLTNEAGYYEFVGIRPGTYAVYQTQPEGFTDGVDTVGSTEGTVFNPGEVVPQSVLQLLEVDPQNDGITRITVQPGQQSVENNFSEVLVERLAEPVITPPADPPFIPPYNPPVTPILPPAAPPLDFGYSNPTLGPPGGGNYQPASEGGAGLTEKPRSWHLSIINGGQPRNVDDAAIAESIWLSAGNAFDSSTVAQGEWLIGAGYGDAASVGTSKVFFGLPGAIPFAADFDGDGYDEIGVYALGEWFIDINGNGRWDSEDLWAKLGNRVDLPVVGDWDGDGKADIGIYGREWQNDGAAVASEPGLPDAENRTFDRTKNVPPDRNEATDRKRLLRRGQVGRVRADVIDHTFRFGTKADLPVTGDWNGDGITTVGIFRDGIWRLDADGNGRWSSADHEHAFGEVGDKPLVGDFDGDGIDDLAVFRAGVVIIDSNGNGEIDSSDRRIQIGQAGDTPVVGDFDGDGVDEVVVYRGSNGQAEPTVIYEARDERRAG